MLRGRSIGIRSLSNYNSAPGADTTSDGSSGNISMSFSDFFSKIKNGSSDLTTTHPSNWSLDQVLAVLTGVVLLWTLILLINFLRKSCDNRRSKKLEEFLENEYVNMGLTDIEKVIMKAEEEHEYRLTRPAVSKGPAPHSYEGGYDASDPQKLPLGVRLHGAQKLRKDGLTGSGVRVAIIDSGIDQSHPGFHNKVQAQRWYRMGTPLEEDDHGTHVAGTIHFMAPDADLYDYRVFGEEGDFDGDQAIAKSIYSAVNVDKCHIINMSLRCSFPVRPEIKKAIRYAYKKGVHMVCAAGNDGDANRLTDELYTYPARFDETISVAAVRKGKGLPSTTFSESNAEITYSGIGRDVISLKPNGGLQAMSGTSMAAPHVTGLIACLLSDNQKYSDSKLRVLLKDKYLVDIGPRGYDKQTGKGFVTYVPEGSKKDAVFDLVAMID